MKPVVIALVLEQHKAKRDVDGNLPVSVRLYDPNTQKAKEIQNRRLYHRGEVRQGCCRPD